MKRPFAYLLSALLLLSSGHFFTQAAGFGPPDEQLKSSASERLQWKFAEGQTTYYSLQTDAETTEVKEGRVSKAEDHSLFLYKWTVVFETKPDLKGINVSFGRVRHETVTADRTITTDTYTPLSTKNLSLEEKSQQDEIYRVLQTNFLFLFYPDLGFAWAESLYQGRPVPPELKTPESTSFFSPDRFTPGDSLSLPRRDVKAGDQWVSPISDSHGAKVQGHYRVLGRVNRSGHDCWQIEGTTTYEPLVDQIDKDIAQVKVGPRTSTHFFDAKIGQLVFGEEQTPLSVDFRDGRHVDTVVKVTRKLEQPTSESSLREVERDLADGTKRKFLFRAGTPVSVQAEGIGVVQSGLMLRGKQIAEGKADITSMEWTISLSFAGQEVKSVRLFDVTGESEIPIDFQKSVNSSKDNWILFFDPTNIDAAEARWFYEEVIHERIIKIVVENQSGGLTTLYQPILVYPEAVRLSNGIVASVTDK